MTIKWAALQEVVALQIRTVRTVRTARTARTVGIVREMWVVVLVVE